MDSLDKLNKKNGYKKQINSSVKLDDIKNKYLLKQIFKYLLNNKTLDIIKYNKKTQKRLDIHINDYTTNPGDIQYAKRNIFRDLRRGRAGRMIAGGYLFTLFILTTGGRM